MKWDKQPVKGILWLIGALILTGIWLVVTGACGLDYFDCGMNWPFAWFFFGFAMIGFFEGWPFAGILKQPWAGILSGTIAWTASAVGWILVNDWLGTDRAYALFSYVEFFLFTICWFYHNEPFAQLSQPTKGIALSVLSAGLGYALYLVLGVQDWEYLYYMPQWYFFFFGDWPISSEKPYQKGTFWAILIALGTFLTHFIFNALGLPITSARGADLFSLLFAGMLVFYALENWPFSRFKQPLQGALLILASIVVAIVAYVVVFNVFGAPDYGSTIWVFSAWCWFAVLAYMMDPWPFRAEAPSTPEVEGPRAHEEPATTV